MAENVVRSRAQFVTRMFDWSTIAQYVSLALALGLGWALHYASLANFLPDVLVIVSATVLLVELRHGKLAPR